MGAFSIHPPTHCSPHVLSLNILLCPPLPHNHLDVSLLSPSALPFDAHLRGPSFVMEPPPKLEFSNSSGGFLDCSATGSPQPSIEWQTVDGSTVGDVIGIRRVLRNGTLLLLPFPAAAYRQDIHNTVYRCMSSNSLGRIITRDVQVRAGKRLNRRFMGFRKIIKTDDVTVIMGGREFPQGCRAYLIMPRNESSSCP